MDGVDLVDELDICPPCPLRRPHCPQLIKGVPGVFDHGFQGIIAGLPGEFLFCLLRVGYQGRRVAGTAGADIDLQVFLGDGLDGVEDLADGKALAIAEIVLGRGCAFHELLHGRDMGSGKVADMDIITDAVLSVVG